MSFRFSSLEMLVEVIVISVVLFPPFLFFRVVYRVFYRVFFRVVHSLVLPLASVSTL